MRGLRQRQDKNRKFLDLALRVVLDRTERRESRCGGADRFNKRITPNSRSPLLAYRSDLLVVPLVNRQRRRGVVLLFVWVGDAAARDGVFDYFSVLAD